ncbi:hypothetical protein DFH09DRAFT_1144408 [Mycena vulgaris]|nr:hypothetical protein DFH09DRAFT_1144408 [Mycena vulgaris]
MLVAFAHAPSLIVHTLALLYLFIIPIAARCTANASYLYSPFPAFAASPSQSSTEHGLTHSHTQVLTAVLGVASLVFILSARTLRRAVSVSAPEAESNDKDRGHDVLRDNEIDGIEGIQY